MSEAPLPPETAAPARTERPARWLALAVIVAAVVSAGSVSWNRAFQIDEVEHMHAAYHVASGRLPYVGFWQLHDPLLYGLLGPITDARDPHTSYRRGRLLMLFLMLGTAGAAAMAAGRLAGPGAAALSGGLLVLHTTFVERGIEIRPDGLAAFLVTLALALQLGEREERRLPAMLAGALLGLALLATKKTVFVAAIFGIWWLVRAWRRRRLAPLAPALATVSVLALAVAAMLALGIFPAYVRATWLTSMEAAGGSEVWIPFQPTRFLAREGLRNLPFVALAGLGWFAAAILHRCGDGLDRRLLFPALLAAGAVASLWLQPFPWPYTHLGILPAVAVIAAAGTSRALGRVSPLLARHRWGVVAGILLLSGVVASPRLLEKASPDPGPRGQARQLALLDEVQRSTAPEDPVFDMAGLYFRPDAYPAYALSSDLLRLVHRGGLPPLIDELRARGVVALIVNYRVDWLQGEERDFFAYRFVHRTDNLFVLGADLAGAPAETDLPWEALAERPFRWEGPPGALSVDGRLFERGTLDRGIHVLRLRESLEEGRLVLETPPLLGQPRPSAPLYVQFD
ncbi:MAG TPA: hypothetical protein VMT85_15985 [Thermoanaerobaculia bacterium]|nr:hypothetical protein [Thermoanaerobaculia bacterium]